jgi:hypothetical protein
VFRAKYVGTVVAVKVLNRGLTASAIDTFTKVDGEREKEKEREREREKEREREERDCILLCSDEMLLLQEISVMSKLHHPHVVLLMGNRSPSLSLSPLILSCLLFLLSFLSSFSLSP